MVRTRMAEADDEQAKAGQAQVSNAPAGQSGAIGQPRQTTQRVETLDHLERLPMEAAVARIEATVARTEANVVRLDRDAAEMRGDVHNVRDQLARVEVKVTRADVTDARDRLARLEANVGRLEAKVARLPGRWFLISAVLIAIAALTAVTLFQDKLLAILGLTY
jgi:hypothetical protein